MQTKTSMGTEEKKDITRPAGARARLFAFGALALLVTGVGYAGNEAYRAATDSFVAPIILSPDNDQVLATKLHASQLSVERARTVSEIEAVDELLAAGQKAITRLNALQRTPQKALAWTSELNARQANAGYSEGKMLAEQHAVLTEMEEKQELLVTAGRANLSAGIISQADLTRELQTRDQLRLAVLENERTRLQTALQLSQVTFARQSIAGAAPPMPELMVHEEQTVRIELEILRLESEQRSKRSEKKTLTDKLATLDEVEAQLKARPIFRAAEKSMDLAFVPYTQLEGVHAGAVVYDCTWGVFNCQPVGAVTELVPGEVVLPDPWGNQARGQYAILALSRHDSAKSKTLRVRRTHEPAAPGSPEREDRVSTK